MSELRGVFFTPGTKVVDDRNKDANHETKRESDSRFAHPKGDYFETQTGLYTEQEW